MVSKNKTVLLVDDNRELTRIYQEILELEGYGALIASTGNEALGLLENGSSNPDLILVDCIMPEMNGEEFIRALNNLKPPLPKSVSVVGFSSFYDEASVVRRFQRVSTDFVEKPDRIEDFLHLVEKYTDGNNHASDRADLNQP